MLFSDLFFFEIVGIKQFAVKKHKGKIEAGEIGLPMENSDLVLPCGIYGRWESK